MSHSGSSECNGCLRTTSSSSFLFLFSVFAGPCDKFPRTSSLILSLLIDAGCCAGVTVSCDEEEVEELVDRPKTTKGTNLPAIFDEVWFLTTGPVAGMPMILAEFSELKNCQCVFEKHYCHE